MVKAEVIKYFTRIKTIGGPGFDKRYTTDSKAIFIPSEQIFVRPDRSSNMICGPSHLMYEVIIGKKAEEEYKKLMEELKTVKPKNIEVSEVVINWAKALHTAINPNKEISDLLNPYE